jgi:hypothetical protein
VTDSLGGRLLPEPYEPGQLPGESLSGEILRRASRKVVPDRLLRRFWGRRLLGADGVWCFVLGVNNSGTTLLHDLLGRHPEVRTLPRLDLVAAEGQWHTDALSVAADHDVPRLFSAEVEAFRLTEADDGAPAVRALHDWGFQYLRHSDGGWPGRVVLEKSPPNVVRSRWLQAHFPRTRFVAMARHPCAVAEGIRRREGHDLRDAARHWAEANRLLLDDLRHLERWTGVHYEELCDAPVATVERLVEFLGLEPGLRREDLTGLDVHSLDESVKTVENFNPRSFDRLSGEEMTVVAEEAGEVAERLGYRVPPDRTGRPGA